MTPLALFFALFGWILLPFLPALREAFRRPGPTRGAGTVGDAVSGGGLEPGSSANGTGAAIAEGTLRLAAGAGIGQEDDPAGATRQETLASEAPRPETVWDGRTGAVDALAA